jgi:hypothetical protein
LAVGIWDLRFGIWDLEFDIWDLGLGMSGRKGRTRKKSIRKRKK